MGIRHLEERNMVIEIEDDDGEDSAVADSRTEVTEGSRLFVQKSGITEDMVVGANDEVVEDVTAKKNVPETPGSLCRLVSLWKNWSFWTLIIHHSCFDVSRIYYE